MSEMLYVENGQNVPLTPSQVPLIFCAFNSPALLQNERRPSTWTLSVSASLWTLTRCSCPLARFLPLAWKTSASLLCWSLYLTSKCPLEQRALDFSTGFYTVKSHRLTAVNINRNINMPQKPMCFTTTKLHLKRIKTFKTPLWNKTRRGNKLKNTFLRAYISPVNFTKFYFISLQSWNYFLTCCQVNISAFCTWQT